MMRSDDGYYALCEYEAKADAVEAKWRLHHSRYAPTLVVCNTPLFSEPWVVRKEHSTGYWEHKAATGLKIDSVSRAKALECLATLGFPVVAGGWDAVLLKPEKSEALAQNFPDASSRSL